MRLIDADALEKSLEKLWNVHDDQDFANKDVWREIENAPTIGSEERTAKVETYMDGQEELWSICECETDVRKGYNYCPKCGAKLEWSQNERFD